MNPDEQTPTPAEATPPVETPAAEPATPAPEAAPTDPTSAETKPKDHEGHKPLTPQEQADHDRSVHDYPDLDLFPNEYVVIDVVRSIWGIIMIWIGAIIGFVAISFAAILVERSAIVNNPNLFFLIVLGAALMSLFGGWLGSFVYRSSRFIVTNQRIFQRLQYAPFSYRSQNIELEHIEDASFRQSGILQSLFHYGTIRLSTFGEEQTYNFTFVADPAEQFKIVNHVIQDVDEQRPTRFTPIP